MKDDTRLWLKYADENLKSAKVLKDNSLFNPCLQNIQQAVEKFLKAVIIEHGFEFRKTHSINELNAIIASHGIIVDLQKEECHFLDSVYLPSKYPISSALPDFEPDVRICDIYLTVADRISASVKEILTKSCCRPKQEKS
jgi:HEPN domain-containing protein